MQDIAIHQALAARIEAVAPPTGYTLRRCYATPPDSIQAPCVVLMPGADTISYGAANRTTTLTINAVLYLTDQVDTARRYEQLLTWRAWMRDVVLGDTTLGSNLVAQASVDSTDIGNDNYGDQTYITITSLVSVAVLEMVNVSA
jgi:hypothetical protein